MIPSYRRGTGKFMQVYLFLKPLLPTYGPVTAANSRQLEAMRRGINAYCDFFGNGGAMLHSDIIKYLGTPIHKFKIKGNDKTVFDEYDWEAADKVYSAALDALIFAAGREQSLNGVLGELK